jgi:hypothetical protein
MEASSSLFSLQTVIWSGCLTAALLSALFVVQREIQKRYETKSVDAVLSVHGMNCSRAHALVATFLRSWLV